MIATRTELSSGFYRNENQAFSLEIKEKKTSRSIERLLASYLGEYRFQLPLYQYQYYFSAKEGLIDPNTDESMLIKAKRAIERRIQERRLIHREQAELEGLEKIRLMLVEKLQEDSQKDPNKFLGTGFFWISPSGEKTDGYGDYGFVFYGIVNRFDFNNFHITMNARRIEQGRNYESLNQLLQLLSGESSINFCSDVEFLKNPMLMSPDIIDPEDKIAEIFEPIDEEILQIFERALGRNGQLKPLLEKAIDAYLHSNIEEFIRLFTALENLSDDLLNSENSFSLIQQINQIPIFAIDPKVIDFYSSYTPQQVSGSCGSTSARKTSNFLQELHMSSLRDLKDLLFNNRYEDYECPQCHGRIKGELKGKPETWHKNCPHCGYRLGCAD